MKFQRTIAIAVHIFAVITSARKGQLRQGTPGNASYDYIVVGGGTAGLAMAARLSLFASVAVVEAGGLYEQDNGNASIVPWFGVLMPFLAEAEDYPHQPLMDWDLLAAAPGDRSIHYAQGKTLGGSSAINSQAYHRANKGAYQRWADLVGDQSYTFDNLLPFFKRSSTLTPPDLEKRNASNATVYYDPEAFDNKLHGPLQVSWANWVDPAQSWLVRGLQAVGMNLSKEGFSSGTLDGGAWIPTTTDPKHATRSTSKSSYLEDLVRKNASQPTIYLRSQANKILFDKHNTATGVVVTTMGRDFVLSAKKEIILSAGVFHSPQLLMLSGIGPADVLVAHSIPIIFDSPGVGQNLQDQCFFGINRGISVPSTRAYLNTPSQQDIALQRYLQNASGPYSAAPGYLSFEKLPSEYREDFSSRTEKLLKDFPGDWPEVEYISPGFPSGSEDFPTVGAITAILLTPMSQGNVTLRSASISDSPLINLNWLTDESDVEILIAAFKRIREMWSHPALADILVGPEIGPGETVSTDAEILGFIKQTAQTIWHASSTCAMGDSVAKGGVVDSQARVFGVKGVRVVDNSIIPFSLPGHPQASVYMLAEKIAHDIKKSQNC